MHKHSLVLLFLSIQIFFLASCQPSEPDTKATAESQKAPIQDLTPEKNGVVLKIEKKQHKVSSNELVVTILNGSSFSLTHGEHWVIEKNINGVWYSVPLKLKALEAGSSLLHPDESIAQTVSLDPYLENDLPPGKYRLVKYFGELMDTKPRRQKNKFILAVPFKVIQSGLFIQ